MNIEEIISNFSLFDDWEDRYRYLIDLGNMLPPMPEELKTDATKVRGCTSQVWMILGWNRDGGITLLADSDAQLVRGLVAVLFTIFNGKTKKEIQSIDVKSIFAQLGLDQHLSQNRRSGFFAMVEKINSFIADGK